MLTQRLAVRRLTLALLHSYSTNLLTHLSARQGLRRSNPFLRAPYADTSMLSIGTVTGIQTGR